MKIMNNSEKLDQKLFKEILINIYEKGEKSKDTKVIDLVEEIKSQINLVLYSEHKS